MTTKSSSMMAVGVQPRSIVSGEISVSGTYNSGATAISDSATVVKMFKIPNGALITDIIWDHSAPAATCPADVGISSGSNSTFATNKAKGTVYHADKAGGVPYRVSKSDDAVIKYDYVTITPTPGSSSVSFAVNMTVKYRMD